MDSIHWFITFFVVIIISIITYQSYEVPYGWRSKARLFPKIQPVVQTLTQIFPCGVEQVKDIVALYVKQRQEWQNEKKKQMKSKFFLFRSYAVPDAVLEWDDAGEKVYFISGPIKEYPEPPIYFTYIAPYYMPPLFGSIIFIESKEATRVCVKGKVPISAIIFSCCIFYIPLVATESLKETLMFIIFLFSGKTTGKAGGWSRAKGSYPITPTRLVENCECNKREKTSLSESSEYRLTLFKQCF